MQKIFIIIGIISIIIGILYPFLKDIGLGKLPGDIHIKKEKFSFYFPVLSCLIVSLVISFVMMFFRK
tara:strand:+ start:45 stop:245 length:201 start_codon:yes stop_codon:yes gene_type:complete